MAFRNSMGERKGKNKNHEGHLPRAHRYHPRCDLRVVLEWISSGGVCCCRYSIRTTSILKGLRGDI
jgi:hypothetical protein